MHGDRKIRLGKDLDRINDKINKNFDLIEHIF